MKKDDCIFCKLANGDIPTNTIYEDDFFRVILDASPANLGHALILPKEHFANIFEADDEYLAKALPLAKKVASVIKEEFKCDGVNIQQNNGTAAGQTVFHLHIHIIPRYDSDNFTLNWPQKSPSADEQKEIAVRLSAKLQ